MRRLDLNDAKALYELWQANYRWHPTPIEIMSLDDFVQQLFLPAHWFEHDGAFVALSGFNYHARRAELTVISPDQRNGHGLAACKAICAYGFDMLGLNSIWSFVVEDNTAIIGLLESVGIKRDGIMRAARWRDGRFIDYHIYSILKSEESIWRV
jgi:RimJ/RimL family protein N-acetyltransferase